MNPYTVLGVAQDATKVDIRAAYRKLAQQHHPDAGGDREKFEEVTVARDVLMDDSRRAHFDETGEVQNCGAENNQAEIITRFSTALRNANTRAIGMARNTAPPRDPFSYDILALAKIELVNHINEVQKQIDSFVEQQLHVTKLAKRFKKDGGEDVIARLFAEDMKSLEASIANCDLEVRLSNKALGLFEGYSFEVDKPPGFTMMFIPGFPSFFNDQQRS